MDVQSLWWRAGRLAYEMPQAGWLEMRWHDAVRRAATVLEPAATPEGYSAGPWNFALPTVALVIYTAQWPDTVASAKDVPIEWIVERVRDRENLESTVRAGLARWDHQGDGDRIGSLFVWLTQDQEPTSKYADLPALENLAGGTLLHAGAEWADRMLTPLQRGTAAA
ncbi:hypothetical protein [Kitasatospora sp. GAS1066B]|uniref:hypothetical protein n=1 Tax=Kitasatospora sp. GAS1066B TaxID=3156271 RepID=UPI0035111AF9